MGAVKEIEIIPREAEDTVPDDRVGHLKGSGDLAIACAGIQAIIEVPKIDGKMRPVVDGEGLGRAGLFAMNTDETTGAAPGE